MMYKYLFTAAFLLAASAPSNLLAVDLILSTSQGNCELQLQAGSNVNIDPSTGNVFATIAQGSTCPEIAGNATLTVSKNGTGTGTVTSSPIGISCGSTCSASFPSGTSVTLNAAAGSGSAFAGWSGACNGTGGCTVSMTQSQSVTATFNTAPTFALTVTKTGAGSGTVTSSPSGINCGSTCSSNFVQGTGVILSANPASGSTFTGWSGEGCSGTGTCAVTMSQARTVSAAFGSSVPGGCEGAAPEGFTRTVNNMQITVGQFTGQINPQIYGAVWRSQSEAQVPWPGNSTSRYLRIPRNTYVSVPFVPDTDGRWTIANTEHTETSREVRYSVSTCPGDFRTSQPTTIPDPTRCIITSIEGQLPFDVYTGVHTGGNCGLQNGETYYLNIMIPTCPSPLSTCSAFMRSTRP